MKIERNCKHRATIKEQNGNKAYWCLKYQRGTDRAKCHECGEEKQDNSK